MVEIDTALMSTVDPPSLQLPATETDAQTRLSDAFDTGRCAVRGVAFWATIPMPLVVVATLLTGFVATSPLLVAGLVVLNVLCAVIGQPYSPDA